MATTFTQFDLSPEVRQGQAGTFAIGFATPVIGFSLSDIQATGIILSNLLVALPK